MNIIHRMGIGAAVGDLHWEASRSHWIPPKKERTTCVFAHDATVQGTLFKQFTRPIDVKAGDELRFFTERGRVGVMVYRNGRCITVRRTER